YMLLLFVLFLLLFALFYLPAMRVEEAGLAATFPGEAEKYFLTVPFFFPLKVTNGGQVASPFRRNDRDNREGAVSAFSWAQVRKNREYEAFFGVVFVLAVFIIKVLYLNH
ncbi:MAG: hypothetical protein ACREJQ_05900, partial [bacterium]